MNIREILEIFDEDSPRAELLRKTANDYTDCDGLSSYSGFVPLPIKSVSTGLNRQGRVISIEDENGAPLGDLYLTNSEEVDIAGISEYLFAAYINEVSKDNFGLPYSFKKDYLIIDLNRFQDYKTHYLDSAPIWGGFIHESSAVILPEPYFSSNNTLRAVPDLIFPTSFHLENSARSVFQPYAFERYLKLYHLLELLFDWDFVQKIKGLGDDLRGIGQILNDHQKDEISLLTSVIQTRCNDFQKISFLLNKILPDPNSIPLNYLYDKGYIIFFDYSKESNPFKDREDKFRALVLQGGFSEQNARSQGFFGGNMTYERFLIKVTAYWIYRIRCCIAHNRIGEYLMTAEDERFVTEFGEPLLREVLIQAFK